MFDHTSVADSARECFVWSREVSRNHNRVWWLIENEAAFAHTSNRLFVDSVDEVCASGCSYGHVTHIRLENQLCVFLARIKICLDCSLDFARRCVRSIFSFSAAT